MGRLLLPMSMLSLLSIGAIFGFFYAWVCSTMWGLDAVDPKIAIAAMQAMNASVRNAVFFPAFFLTPVILAVTAFIAARQHRRHAALLFAASAGIYVGGAFLVTAMVNVPMNDALAQISGPANSDAARQIWQDYSAPWQFWNTLRTLFCGLALLLTGFAILSLNTENT
jgi:uncharacterized membrane protein